MPHSVWMRLPSTDETIIYRDLSKVVIKADCKKWIVDGIQGNLDDDDWNELQGDLLPRVVQNLGLVVVLYLLCIGLSFV